MIDPARGVFDSLNSWAALEQLIASGEPEGPYLECKTSAEPRLARDQRVHLATALSGFGNTAGGVVIWGISTTHHSHSGLDVLTEIEPIGQCVRFRQQVDVAMPTLAYPALEGCSTKVLHPTAGATRGVALAYIPKTPSDPVQALFGEKRFYLRTGAEFVEMPYETLKRMFVGAAGPDVVPLLPQRLVTKDAAGVWTIPIALSNRSSAAAERTKITVSFLNSSACAGIVAVSGFRDIASVNPGEVIYAGDVDLIYRGFNQILGQFAVTMKKGKRPRRILKVRIRIYSTRMRARSWDITIQLAASGFSVKQTQAKFLY